MKRRTQKYLLALFEAGRLQLGAVAGEWTPNDTTATSPTFTNDLLSSDPPEGFRGASVPTPLSVLDRRRSRCMLVPPKLSKINGSSQMRVVIQLQLDEALALQTGQPATPALQQVLQIITELGGNLKPLHPGATHPLLAPYFTVDVPNALVADQLIARLLANSAVAAAYVEPSVSPP